ncbi:MAG TPA: AraC family transcriptional regulator [Gemmatimonadaceae bacterium]|nr:AraC family transcriptional regulator [Gemmatimonadaceae bacterium]
MRPGTATALAPRLLRRVGGYREYAPPPDLVSVVDAPWVYFLETDAEIPGRARHHRILPEPGVSLSFACVRDERGRVLDARLNFQGPIRAIQMFVPGNGLRLEAVRLAPEWSRVLVRADAADHADRVDPYDFVHRRHARRLYARLTRTTSSREAVQVLLEEVRDLRDQVNPPRSARLPLSLAAMIRAERGTLSLAGIAQMHGISTRHLRRLVVEATGIGPRWLHRIHRLNRAVSLADACEHPEWARVAADSGYCDQSHMIREFVSITGQSPLALHRERQAENIASAHG